MRRLTTNQRVEPWICAKKAACLGDLGNRRMLPQRLGAWEGRNPACAQAPTAHIPPCAAVPCRNRLMPQKGREATPGPDGRFRTIRMQPGAPPASAGPCGPASWLPQCPAQPDTLWEQASGRERAARRPQNRMAAARLPECIRCPLPPSQRIMGLRTGEGFALVSRPEACSHNRPRCAGRTTTCPDTMPAAGSAPLFAPVSAQPDHRLYIWQQC